MTKDTGLTVLILSAANSVHTVRWANALAERGLSVHLAYLPNHAPSQFHKILDNVMLHKLKYSGHFGYYLNGRQLRNLHNQVRPDVINAHYASGYGTLARVSRLKPVLLSVWGSDVYDFPFKNPLSMRIVKRNLRYAHSLASTSECMARQVQSLVGEKTVHITPFGVNMGDYIAKDNQHRSRDSKTIRIGNIKTLMPTYGIDTMIKATRYLINSLAHHGYEELAKTIRVDIYGEGPQRHELELLISSLGLEGIVSLRGTIPNANVPQVLKTFDIFCVTSNRESFGVALVEAMAAAVPVVATDTEGFREVMDEGATGLIVECNSPRAVSVALESLVHNDKLRKQLGLAGKHRVQERYIWDENVTAMIKAYQETIREEGT